MFTRATCVTRDYARRCVTRPHDRPPIAEEDKRAPCFFPGVPRPLRTSDKNAACVSFSSSRCGESRATIDDSTLIAYRAAERALRFSALRSVASVPTWKIEEDETTYRPCRYRRLLTVNRYECATTFGYALVILGREKKSRAAAARIAHKKTDP